MSKAVFGLVDSESQAERIVDSLKSYRFCQQRYFGTVPR